MHTPGPWKAEGFKDLVVNTADGITLACCPGDTRKPGGIEETQANAKLIAAAPELLAVLESAASWFGELGNDDGAQGLLDDIRAAIAKAKGK